MNLQLSLATWNDWDPQITLNRNFRSLKAGFWEQRSYLFQIILVTKFLTFGFNSVSDKQTASLSRTDYAMLKPLTLFSPRTLLHSLSYWKRGGAPWTASPAGSHWDKQNWHPFKLAPSDSLKSPINPTCMLLDWGRNTTYLERTARMEWENI